MNRHAYFFDRCCPRVLARVIKAYEDAEVRYFDDDARFEKTTMDEAWLSTLAGDSTEWVIISADANILRKPHELAVLQSSRLKFFLLGKAWQNMNIHEKCVNLLKAWPRVVTTAAQTRHRLFEIHGGSGLKIEERS